MSPRGVAIPGIRRQLFDAAERVLLRAGPAGLTGRAITKEAGCATGLLYNHFADLDTFLAALVLDRAGSTSASMARLPGLAGSGDVVDNLMSAVRRLFTGNLLALAGLVMARPAIIGHLGEAFADGTLEIDAGERAFADYLRAEQEHGRIRAETDVESFALALVGAAHQLLLTRGPQAPDLHERMRRTITALISAVTPQAGAEA
ncbi:TetR/AcrR family transcriptional regulator [Nonomuraea jiangxiensis]|uniref:DNA-binding transcriptional regulator, AcrR family n=1 Tax=Nonomuraea jiangxiensis TaxID=633440 RepID=A0A1G8DHS8_9ACTN|nr:TetR/AcrR family transcriptional regulator [Nonomuraea jiangxiensis]SDH57173.1 DNA-binding transcriptional regulator, AcrR family [Nonomuraea jiangxiensis]